MAILLTLFFCAFFGLGTLDSAQAASFRFFTESLAFHRDISLDNCLEILKYLDKAKPIFIYVSDYNNKVDGEDTVKVVSSLLAVNKTNVVALNWEKESKGVVSALAKAKLVAKKCGKSIVSLIKEGIPSESINFMGFGLGAHLAGWVGEEVQKYNYVIESIHGLDPTGPAFRFFELNGLNPSRAKYVYGLHTNPGGYGINERVGIVDFWANCKTKKLQPGCSSGFFLPFAKAGMCSHDRSWEIVSEAILNPESFPASAADSCDSWKTESDVINYIGKVDPSKQGNFYLTTNDKAPFGKAKSGLKPKCKACHL